MTDISDWENTAAGNNKGSTPDYMPESATAVKEVNNWGREVQAGIRRFYEAPDWRDFGHTTTFVDATHFDVTPGGSGAMYVVGQRIRVTDGSGTLYTTIAGIATDRIQTVDNLTAPVTAVAVGPDLTGQPIPVAGVKNGNALAVPAAANNIALLNALGQVVDSGRAHDNAVDLGGATPANAKIPSQAAVKSYVDTLIDATPRVLFRGGQVTVANTTTETDLFNQTIPADSLLIGASYVRALHIKAALRLRADTGETMTFELTFGTTVIGRLIFSHPGDITGFRNALFEATIYPIDQNNQRGTMSLDTSSRATDGSTETLNGNEDSNLAGHSTIAEDLSTGLPLILTGQHNVASVNKVIELYGLTVEAK